MPTIRKGRIVIATAGTLGDLLPLIELGRALEARGHDVTLACSTGLQSWVTRSGLQTARFDGEFGKERAQQQAKYWDQWDEAGPAEADAELTTFFERVERNSRELATLARSAALLLVPTNCIEGRLVHELTGVRWLSVSFMPQTVIGPAPRQNDPREALLAMHVARLERRLGVQPSRPYTTYRDYKRSRPSLLACSRALVEAAEPGVWQTGFWFYEDPAWASWRPEPRLIEFLAEREPPLVLSFSSLPLVEPVRVLGIHARAARILGLGLVVQQGWSGFSRDQLPSDLDPNAVYMADFLPHDWFLSRAAGLITHGGAGTVGRALRNACPLLIEPYGNDQFHNALLVKRRRYGTAVHPRRLDPERLARVLKERLLDERVRRQVGRASEVIAREDGVRLACELIEGFA